MVYDELTHYQKMRFCNCIYCGGVIKRREPFKMVITKKGRCSVYTFIHERCIFSAREWLKNKEERRNYNGKDESRIKSIKK